MTQPTPRAQAITRTRPNTSVVIVSASISAQFVESLQAEADISVIGRSSAVADAVDLVARLHPNVVILELDVAGGYAQQAIQRIMVETPTPILLLAPTGTDDHFTHTMEALGAGAVEAMPKPIAWTDAGKAEIRRRVRVLRGVTVLRKPRRQTMPPASEVGPRVSGRRSTRVVAIGASTGGPVALAAIVSSLRGIQAPVLVVQHMHVDFVAGLVTWMARVASVPVRAALHGRALEPGVVYIGPGNVHLKIGPGRRIVLDAEPVTAHRPSADQLFLSVAEHVGRNAIGVVLTGMGDDGSAGLLAIRERGGMTIAQDEETSVVFGMPKAAHQAGAAVHVMPLDAIGPAIVKASMGLQL